MTVEELYQKLKSPAFQDTKNGDLFYNFFIFQYPAKDEYEIRRQIKVFEENLPRPDTYVKALTLDLFEEFCSFLDGQSFGYENPSLLRFLMNTEKDAPSDIQDILVEQANCQEFYQYIHSRIMEHVNVEDEMKRSYVFVYGVGDMFPYLRASIFLTNYEQYNETSRYKIIVFYPGQSVGNTFSLFNILDDAHAYRAILLLNDNNE